MTDGLRRVAVTGMGIVCSIGDSLQSVTDNLKNGTSGISFAQNHLEFGFRSLVHGKPTAQPQDHIGRRTLRSMGDGAAWCYMAMKQAIADAGLAENEISHPRTGLIVGTGGPTTSAIVAAADIVRQRRSPRKTDPFCIAKAMSSTASATLSTEFKIRGVNYSITSACTTSLHCIGAAAEQIRWNNQDIVICGGGEELHWTLSCMFDGLGALSSKFNNTPQLASRPFDIGRDGFVISAGAGILVLEDLEHAKSRNANIYAEITGYGANSDGYNLVAPSGEGAVRVMNLALKNATRPPDYINPHATSTPIGDEVEIQGIKKVFGQNASDQPLISSTKSMTGHSLGAAGAHEAIYSLLMMKEKFVAPSINIEELDPAAAGSNIVRETRNADLRSVMSCSFGFGGTNGAVVFTAV